MSAKKVIGAGLAALAAIGATGSAALAAPAAGAATEGPTTSVLVRELPGAGHAPEAAVAALGGSVTRQLGIIDGFSAELPASAVPSLRSSAGVATVTFDAAVRLSTATYDATGDVGSMYNTASMVGAQEAYGKGLTGRGVDVAVIDSGIAKVKGLDATGKVLHGPDLSFDSQNKDRTNTDGFGHGTHMAGIIAGYDGGRLTPKDERVKSFNGIAPGARILSMKVADANGASDVSQVIAALDWVAQHGRRDGLNVRVINLSFGTQSLQSHLLDPLSYAAEQAWKRGYVVVVSAGNDGDGTGRLNNPAYNPFVLAVGADDTRGTTSLSDDVIPAWSSKGDGTRNPDLVAPGASIQSLASKGSFLEQKFPEAIRDSRFFKGSGTSQAAAVTSGAVALLLEQRPGLSPDQVKAILRSSARTLPAAEPVAQGAGLLDVSKMISTSVSAGNAAQVHTAATGTGSLDAARGGARLESSGVVLQGEVDIFGVRWDGTSWAQASANGTSWAGSSWRGSSWAGSSWAGCSWAGTSWAGSSWRGASWAGASWAGSSWRGSSWAGSSWR